MTFALDVVTLGVTDPAAAHDFYAAALAPEAADYGSFVDLDLHGSGHVGLYDAGALATEADADAAAASGFRGFVLSAILNQPGEVSSVVQAAVEGGASILKPGRKGFFGGFHAVCRMPDGSIWKLSSAKKKDSGPARLPPPVTETIAILGVASPKASKAFYEAVGLRADHDYGDKFVDFEFTAGACRLGLMPRKELAKDAGVAPEGAGFSGLVLHHRAAAREDVDDVLAAAVAAGGRVTVPAEETEWGGYCAHFADLDGFVWKVACAR